MCLLYKTEGGGRYRMFMGKVEWENTIKLLKIRNKESQVVKGICFVLLALFGIDLYSVIRKIMEHSSEVVAIHYQTYSVWAFVLIMICLCLVVMNYNQYHCKIQIFPQSKKSELVSFLLFCYQSIIKVLIFSLVLYLIQYGISEILTMFFDNVNHVYKFNILFILSGFLVNILYGFLIISFIILLGVLDRKYRITFRIIAIGAFLISYINYVKGNYILNRILGFIMGETSIIIFTIKGTFLLLVFIAICLYINEKTKYYQVDKGFILSNAIVGVAIGLIMYIVLSFFMFSTDKMESSIVEVKEPKINFGNQQVNNSYKVDVSHLPDGSTILLNFPKKLSEEYSLYYDNESVNLTNDQIIIDFVRVRKFADWVDLYQFMDVQIDQKLEGNTLILNIVSKENVKVFFISPFSFMWQFDYFRDKQILKEKAGSMGGGGGGNISIYLPEGKKLKVVK